MKLPGLFYYHFDRLIDTTLGIYVYVAGTFFLCSDLTAFSSNMDHPGCRNHLAIFIDSDNDEFVLIPLLCSNKNKTN